MLLLHRTSQQSFKTFFFLENFCPYHTKYCSNPADLKFGLLDVWNISNTPSGHWDFYLDELHFWETVNRFGVYEFHSIKLKKFDKWPRDNDCVLRFHSEEPKIGSKRWAFPYGTNRLEDKPQTQHAFSRIQAETWMLIHKRPSLPLGVLMPQSQRDSGQTSTDVPKISQPRERRTSPCPVQQTNVPVPAHPVLLRAQREFCWD